METVKTDVYRDNPDGIDELKRKIITEFRKIIKEELIHVNDNFIKTCQKCVATDGHHFQNRL